MPKQNNLTLIKNIFTKSKLKKAFTVNEIHERTGLNKVTIYNACKFLCENEFLTVEVKRMFSKKVPTKIYKLNNNKNV